MVSVSSPSLTDNSDDESRTEMTTTPTHYGSINDGDEEFQESWRLAQQGDAEAQWKVGRCYDLATNTVTENGDWAVYWYQQSADQGHAGGQNGLGCCYHEGKGFGGTPNLTKALELYQLAAAQGWAKAQCNLAYCYENGIVVDKDLKRAVGYYEMAAQQGHAPAQCNLGYCHHNGHGIPQDWPLAVHYYQLAAAQGHAVAQYNLGCCFDNGQGVSPCRSQALRWYKMAADQEYAAALHRVGKSFVTGDLDAPPDLTQALHWLQKAHDKGSSAGTTLLRQVEQLLAQPTTQLQCHGRINNHNKTADDAMECCPVCLQDLDQCPAPIVRTTRCQHVFCLSCMSEMLQQKHECAMCRGKVDGLGDCQRVEIVLVQNDQGAKNNDSKSSSGQRHEKGDDDATRANETRMTIPPPLSPRTRMMKRTDRRSAEFTLVNNHSNNNKNE